MKTEFIRLTKSNKSKDRLLIAIDGICAVEECSEQNHTRIMTMDGFWYEVVDDIVEIDRILSGTDQKKDDVATTKKTLYKKKKALSPAIDKPLERPTFIG